MAKHTVYTELASGIQMHPAHTLLPLVFFLKGSYEEGEMETQIFSRAQWAETSQNFGVNLKQCLLEKGSHRCGASCWISTPPPPLSQAPSRTAEPAWLYTHTGKLREAETMLKGHKKHVLLLFPQHLFPTFQLTVAPFSTWNHTCLTYEALVCPVIKLPCPPDHVLTTAWGRPESYPGISHSCLPYYFLNGWPTKEALLLLQGFYLVVGRKNNQVSKQVKEIICDKGNEGNSW